MHFIPEIVRFATAGRPLDSSTNSASLIGLCNAVSTILRADLPPTAADVLQLATNCSRCAAVCHASPAAWSMPLPPPCLASPAAWSIWRPLPWGSCAALINAAAASCSCCIVDAAADDLPRNSCCVVDLAPCAMGLLRSTHQCSGRVLQPVVCEHAASPHAPSAGRGRWMEVSPRAAASPHASSAGRGRCACRRR